MVPKTPPLYRLIHFNDGLPLHKHLLAHFSGPSGRPPIAYKKKFKCAFPPCDGEVKRKLGDAIEHLHHIYGYPLLRVTEGVTEVIGDDNLFLPDQFQYHDDVLCEAQYKPSALQEHPVSLVDRRRKPAKARAQERIAVRYGTLPAQSKRKGKATQKHKSKGKGKSKQQGDEDNESEDDDGDED